MSQLVHERQQVKDQQSSISVFVAYLKFQVAASGNSPNVATVINAWAYKDKEQPQEKKTL